MILHLLSILADFFLSVYTHIGPRNNIYTIALHDVHYMQCEVTHSKNKYANLI